MSNYRGMDFEQQFFESLNNKCCSDLNPNLQKFICTIFKTNNKGGVISCQLVRGFMKPDIEIVYLGKTVYVSLKTGTSKTVHQERISTFIQFLKDNKISEGTIETILLLHYADGTTDGTGEKRYSFLDMNFNLQERIKKANIELNRDSRFVMDFLEKVMFVGVIENAIPATHIYHGDCEFGYFASKEQVKRFVLLKSWDFMTNLHIGPFQFRAHARYLDSEIKNVEARHKCDVWWANFHIHISRASKIIK